MFLDQCYKKIYVRNLRFFEISQNACPWQACHPQSNKHQLITKNLKLRTKKFHNIGPRCHSYITFFFVTDFRQNRLTCLYIAIFSGYCNLFEGKLTSSPTRLCSSLQIISWPYTQILEKIKTCDGQTLQLIWPQHLRKKFQHRNLLALQHFLRPQYSSLQQARVFVTPSHFHPGLIFASKAGACLSGTPN